MSSTNEKWKHQYSDKIVDADTAMKCAKNGQRIFVGSGASEPQALVTALTRRGAELADLEIVHIMTLGTAPYAEKGYDDIFRHNALFVGTNVREAVAEGRADYTPIFLSEIPRLFRTRAMPLDIALIQVSPPDEHGFCSYGVSVDIVKSAAESAEVVIAEVNSHMPRTLGDSFIHVKQIDYLVENQSELIESVPAEPGKVAMQIGRHVVRLIDDGSTLQLGIGTIPNAVLKYLGESKNLGIHTEMLSDGIVDLIESGVVNCSQKTLLVGKVVVSFIMGTRRLYDYVDNNPIFEFRPVEFTNDPFTIARNEKMVAINSAIEVDLTGQVCSDSMGQTFYSGIGGQVDFIRGASHSKGGKPIIVIPSTAKGGRVSRIVLQLQQGAGVVTTRGDVHYIVTEYGIAELWGKNVRERALSLISIAHPKFRTQLLEDAKKRNLLYEDQILLPTTLYPEKWETDEVLRDGTRVFVRPVKTTDEPLLKEMFYSSSEDTIHQRFFLSVSAMPHTKLQEWANVDYENEMCVVVSLKEKKRKRLVAMASYMKNQANQMADVAFLVHDDFQNRGIGTLLLKHLIRIAEANGILGFTADVLPENRHMLNIFHKSGCEINASLEDGIYRVKFRFETAKKAGGSEETVSEPGNV